MKRIEFLYCIVAGWAVASVWGMLYAPKHDKDLKKRVAAAITEWFTTVDVEPNRPGNEAQDFGGGALHIYGTYDVEKLTEYVIRKVGLS